MSTTRQRRAELLVLMWCRRLGFGRNPLRRRVDRIESTFLLSALVAGLLVVPAAAALGTTAWARNAALGIAAGLSLPMFVWPLLFGLFRLARRPLDRRRTQDWARDWEQVGPRWTRHQP
ncbi:MULTISPECIES: hypothetical protein [unclassified Kribbella]|uniref:hypothetical protein n=1 Tax=unclassified Kribbella TaxID=2644121 RepID=UPI0030778EF5